MLFLGPAREPMVAENCIITALHAMLMAEVFGVGTCFSDLIPPACNRVPALKEMLGIEDGLEAHVSLTMGYPDAQFLRAIPRRAAEIRYL